MKKRLLLLWINVMMWQSKLLRRRVNRLAERLSKACEKQERHNNTIMNVELMVDALVKSVERK